MPLTTHHTPPSKQGHHSRYRSIVTIKWDGCSETSECWADSEVECLALANDFIGKSALVLLKNSV